MKAYAQGITTFGRIIMAFMVVASIVTLLVSTGDPFAIGGAIVTLSMAVTMGFFIEAACFICRAVAQFADDQKIVKACLKAATTPRRVARGLPE